MTKIEFVNELKRLNLTKKEFSELVGFSYSSVNNWNDEKYPIPSWVESWLKNYDLAMRYKEYVKKL